MCHFEMTGREAAVSKEARENRRDFLRLSFIIIDLVYLFGLNDKHYQTFRRQK